MKLCSVKGIGHFILICYLQVLTGVLPYAGSSCGSSAATSSTDSSSDSEDRCDSSLGLEDDRDFLVEILPHLYLGNAANSEDSEALSRNHIQVRCFVLNIRTYCRRMLKTNNLITV